MNNETKLKCYLDSFTHAATIFFATICIFLFICIVYLETTN